MRMRILYKVLLGGGTLKLQKMGMRTIKQELVSLYV